MPNCPILFRAKLSYNLLGVITMADYREMYIKLFQETTRAILILQKARQDCGELYISSPEPKLILLPEDPKQ